MHERLRPTPLPASPVPAVKVSRPLSPRIALQHRQHWRAFTIGFRKEMRPGRVLGMEGPLLESR